MESDPEEHLKLALEKGDAESVWEVLFGESGHVCDSFSEAVDPNCGLERSMWKPLTYAAYRGHIDVVRVLLSHPKCRVNLLDGNSWTALQVAVCLNRIDVAKLLLDHPDIDLECKTRTGTTPLGFCISAEMAALLLGHGGEVGGPPLEWACEYGTLMQVRVLLEHGAIPLFGDLLKKTNLPEKRKLLLHYIDGVWKDGVPSLADLCAWKMKRMKSKVDQRYMVDERLPDALVAKYFNDWEGAAKWCVPWLPEMIEDAKVDAKELVYQDDFKELKAEVARLEAMLESGPKDMEEWEAAGRPTSGTQWIEREIVEEFRARMGREWRGCGEAEPALQ